MSDLIAIGYPDETTADDAAAEARRLAQDLIIQPDAIAVIVRDKEGKYHTHTSHHMVGGGATWGMWWGMLFGLLFFVPLLGAAIGAGLGALTGSMADVGIDDDFINSAKERVTPGTSALFLLSSDAVIDRVKGTFAGLNPELIASNLSSDQEAKLSEVFTED
jgi:uncharacterized membrane protein